MLDTVLLRFRSEDLHTFCEHILFAFKNEDPWLAVARPMQSHLESSERTATMQHETTGPFRGLSSFGVQLPTQSSPP